MFWTAALRPYKVKLRPHICPNFAAQTDCCAGASCVSVIYMLVKHSPSTTAGRVRCDFTFAHKWNVSLSFANGFVYAASANAVRRERRVRAPGYTLFVLSRAGVFAGAILFP